MLPTRDFKQASMNKSNSPSETAVGLELSQSVLRSLTMLYRWSKYERI